MLDITDGYYNSDIDEPARTHSRSKQQYTVKGIEEETVRLMRQAAQSDGMKIGAWISARMKDAAFKSLEKGPSNVMDEQASVVRCLQAMVSKDFEQSTNLPSKSNDLVEIREQLNAIMRNQLSLIDLIVSLQRERS